MNHIGFLGSHDLDVDVFKVLYTILQHILIFKESTITCVIVFTPGKLII